jgi:hypothetical protein
MTPVMVFCREESIIEILSSGFFIHHSCLWFCFLSAIFQKKIPLICLQLPEIKKPDPLQNRAFL